MTKRLHKLEEEGFLISRVSPRVNATVYLLDKKGGRHAADLLGREVSNVWSHCPKDADIFHDLMVAGLIRIVVDAVEEKRGYEIDFFLLEHCMKATTRPRKNLCYPDFKIGIVTPAGPKTYDVEVDCGTISRRDFLSKMNSFENVTLIVSNTLARMTLLCKYAARLYRNKTVYANTFEKVKKEGFFTGKWFLAKGNCWEYLCREVEHLEKH
ncbi:MAG: hypothetical protein ACHQ0Y_08155 [Thermodesulfovibrionales bacterium]